MLERLQFNHPSDARIRPNRAGRGVFLLATIGWLLSATWQARAVDDDVRNAVSQPAEKRSTTTSDAANSPHTREGELRRRNVAKRAAIELPNDPDRRIKAIPNGRTEGNRSAAISSKPIERMPTTQPVHILPTTRPAAPAKPKEPVDYGDDDVVTLPSGDKAYRLRYKFDDKPRYLIIEDEFQDRGGVPGLLTFTANASDRYTIVQRVADAGMRVTRPGASNSNEPAVEHSTNLEWTIDRFEAKEKAMGESSKFDSLRDTYPVAALRRLGTVPGSKATFLMDRWTGETSQVRIQPGRSSGPATRRKLSKTTQRCLFDNNTAARILDDLGELILPRVPKKIGEPWKRERDDALNNFGKSVVEFTFKIDRIEETDGRSIAHVSISGETRLVPDEQNEDPTPRVPTPRDRNPNRKKQKRHDFKIDSSAVTGKFSFDITRGALIDLMLQRDLGLSAEMESEKMGPMKLETSTAHTMRVTCSDTEPAKPIIVGGPKPPPPDPEDLAPRKNRSPRNKLNRKTTDAAAARKRANSEDYEARRKKALERLEERRQKARARNRTTTQPTTTQPASMQRIRPRPATTTMPAKAIQKRPHPKATTQPAKRPVITPKQPPSESDK